MAIAERQPIMGIWGRAWTTGARPPRPPVIRALVPHCCNKKEATFPTITSLDRCSISRIDTRKTIAYYLITAGYVPYATLPNIGQTLGQIRAILQNTGFIPYESPWRKHVKFSMETPWNPTTNTATTAITITIKNWPNLWKSPRFIKIRKFGHIAVTE